MATYDIIGDIHGHGDKLKELLRKLGWATDGQGVYAHSDPDHRAIFVGDLIDRGPNQREVLAIAKDMVDAGRAQVLMGNHEFNAICFATPDPSASDKFLRPHTGKNCKQHASFLDQLSDMERAEWVAWFRTLPLWLDLTQHGGPRVVHACWHQSTIDDLTEIFGGPSFPPGDEMFIRASNSEDVVHAAIEILLKGPEIDLGPYGIPDFVDHGGHTRHRARVQWWKSDATTIGELTELKDLKRADGKKYGSEHLAKPAEGNDLEYAYTEDIAVIFGHHWREWKPGHGEDFTDHTACVDFSAGKKGPLVAYRWTGSDPTARVDRDSFVRSGQHR